MYIHPNFDPIAVSLGPLAIRWYALGYIAAFALFIILGRRRIKQGNTLFTNEMLDDLLTWGVAGVILGGRIGYVLFYNLQQYLNDPISIFKVWIFWGFDCSILFCKKTGATILASYGFCCTARTIGLSDRTYR